MRESKTGSPLRSRHASCCISCSVRDFAFYPALNVLSISLRPGNRLRSTDLAIIPADWTLTSYKQLFTEQPFLRGSAIR